MRCAIFHLTFAVALASVAACSSAPSPVGGSLPGPDAAAPLDLATPIADLGQPLADLATGDLAFSMISDGSLPPPLDLGDLCAPYDLTGVPAITPTIVVGSAPVPTGGTILDGTYVLTSTTSYVPQMGTGTSSVVKQVYRYENNVFRGTTLYNGSTSSVGGTFTTSGTTQQRTYTCPMSLSFDLQYTATPTTVTLFIGVNPVSVNVFEKQ